MAATEGPPTYIFKGKPAAGLRGANSPQGCPFTVTAAFMSRPWSSQGASGHCKCGGHIWARPRLPIWAPPLGSLCLVAKAFSGLHGRLSSHPILHSSPYPFPQRGRPASWLEAPPAYLIGFSFSFLVLSCHLLPRGSKVTHHIKYWV